MKADTTEMTENNCKKSFILRWGEIMIVAGVFRWLYHRSYNDLYSRQRFLNEVFCVLMCGCSSKFCVDTRC